MREYDSPLDEVVSSTLLGSPGFITFIKDRFLSGKKFDKDLPALKELVEKASMQDVFDEVESVFRKRTGFVQKCKNVSFSEIYRRKAERYWHTFQDWRIRRVPGKQAG